MSCGRRGVLSRRHLAGGCAVAALASVLAIRGAGAQEAPEFGVEADLVQIDALVLDRDGRPVTGLRAEDFEVEENGQIQPIVSFEAIRLEPSVASTGAPDVSAPQPLEPEEHRDLVFFFDDVHLSDLSVIELKRTLGPFLAGGLSDADRVTLVAPVSGIYWTSRSGREHRYLPRVLERLSGGFVRYPFEPPMSEWQAMRLIETESPVGGSRAASRGLADEGAYVDERGNVRSLRPSWSRAQASSHIATPVELYEVAQRRLRGTLNALRDVLARLAPARGRKTVLLFSEGFIRPPHLRAFADLVDDARRANVVVEFVNTHGLGATPTAGYGSPDDNERSPLMRLELGAGGTAFVAEATGGRSSISNDPTRAARIAIRESSAYYLLGYALPPGRKGERRVKVRVRGEGLEVRARTRYYVGAAGPEVPDLPPAGRALRLLEDVDDLAVRVRTLEAAGSGRTTLLVEVPPPETPRERRLRLVVEARPLAGGEPFRESMDVTIPATRAPARFTREWTLAPGVWQARIVAEDVDTGALGSLSHTFEASGS